VVTPQLALVHWLLRVQAPPEAWGGWQSEPSHQKPVAHFASPVASFEPQVVSQLVAFWQMKLPAQALVVPVPQLPAPSHSPAPVSWPLLQLADPQIVLEL